MSQVAKTHTVNIYKGTPAFMAPEIVNPAIQPQTLSEEQLKKADIWSLGMSMFCLVNPDCQVRYVKEASQADKRKWVEYISRKASSGIYPEESMRYEYLQASTWVKAHEAFLACIQVDPIKLPKLDEIEEILNQEETSDDYPLVIRQGTALIQASEKQIDSGMYEHPENDGTNACMFLSLKNAELLLQEAEKSWDEVKEMAEHVISDFPRRVNPLRDDTQTYEVTDAHALLRSQKPAAPFELSSCCKGYRVFSKEDIKELNDVLSKDSGSFMVVVPPYAFALRKVNTYWVVIDTNVIGPSLGGNGNGIVKVFHDSKSTKRWICRRLASNGIRESMLGITEISMLPDSESHR